MERGWNRISCNIVHRNREISARYPAGVEGFAAGLGSTVRRAVLNDTGATLRNIYLEYKDRPSLAGVGKLGSSLSDEALPRVQFRVFPAQETPSVRAPTVGRKTNRCPSSTATCATSPEWAHLFLSTTGISSIDTLRGANKREPDGREQTTCAFKKQAPTTHPLRVKPIDEDLELLFLVFVREAEERVVLVAFVAVIAAAALLQLPLLAPLPLEQFRVPTYHTPKQTNQHPDTQAKGHAPSQSEEPSENV